MQVTLDMVGYIEAVRYVTEHNPIYMGEEDQARVKLDSLIAEAIKSETTVSSGGFHVRFQYYNENTKCCCIDILVSPSLGKESFFMTITI